MTALKHLETLTASLAHELLQPLTSVLINAEVATRLLSQSVPDVGGAIAALEDILRDDRRATELIEHIRSLLKRGPVMQRCNVHETMTDALKVLRSETAQLRVEVHRDFGDESAVCADRVLLRQVLVNLLRNAFDAATAPKAGSRKVTLRTHRSEDGRTLIAVEDEGARTSDAHFSRLGEALFTSKPDGLGLGLVLCREILFVHGSELLAERKETGGMIFSFSLRRLTP